MAIKLEMLRTFCIVAEAGSLADAAVQLGRTQSAVSMALKQLEEDLGQRLFAADRKNLLSAFGEKVFRLAQQEVQQFDETLRAIRTVAQTRAGLVRVAAVPSLAARVYPALAQRSARAMPGLRLDLRDAEARQVLDLLRRGQVDIGIASSRHLPPDTIEAPLVTDRYGLVLGKRHPLASTLELPDIQALDPQQFIQTDLSRGLQNDTVQALNQAAGLTVRNTLSLIALLQSGAWYTILPKSVLHVAPAGLVFRALPDVPDQREVKLMLRQSGPFADQAKSVFDMLQGMDWSSDWEGGPGS